MASFRFACSNNKYHGFRYLSINNSIIYTLHPPVYCVQNYTYIYIYNIVGTEYNNIHVTLYIYINDQTHLQFEKYTHVGTQKFLFNSRFVFTV